ncbi:MAG: 8-amino-7-oxononanoate synthase [Deltaproteobacteria bacterium ADurb.Bin151]|jgi:8-amino-7-oxononanoate synthase|nr:8-amino-7-oxononanoate synthase [Smithella sp.]OQB54794.1 MAG: 8-amino-7-oxononanoate synthase [Deltaproteobacteria bacterium ADurb.Bin151]HOQ42269.1 8-amino-7-oxononanoate synthase [Smithellaceae bacterium]HPL65713.1 8-amino-7-oxononanoate synthase [Smithellaceae bacterium]HQP25048.1 8-amino-7-oxononanoate synthase [Smithellaceae bacterium]
MTENLFDKKLQQIKADGLHRQMRYLESPQGSHVRIAGEDILMLSSNSYLGLCFDDRLRSAAHAALEQYGTGSGGSRLTTGSYDIHKKLEEEIAAFKGTEAALVFATGYMANVGIISAVAGKNWVIFSDRLSHASIIDGCRLSGAEIVVYEHCNPADLERKTSRYRGRQGLIVTDGLFSVDGDIAPLPALVEIARKHQLLLMVDDAHATGVLGKNGGGTAEHFGLDGGIDIVMGTLSKALASEGGFVAGSHSLMDCLVNSARSFIFSTAPAPATIAVSIAALDIVRKEPAARETLRGHSLWFRKELRTMGFNVEDHPTPIISIVLGRPDVAVDFSKRLMAKKIFVSAIRPPTVPAGTSRLRINIMATHKKEELTRALVAIGDVGRSLGVISS